MTDITNTVPLYFKLGGCLFLVLQSVVVLVLMKSLGGGSDGFINSTVVLSSELVKLLLSLPFVMKEAYTEAMRSESNPAEIPHKRLSSSLKVIFQLPSLYVSIHYLLSLLLPPCDRKAQITNQYIFSSKSITLLPRSFFLSISCLFTYQNIRKDCHQ